MYARDTAIRELLDGDTLDEAALRRNLRDIRRINALLGWRAFTTTAVARVVRSEGLRAFSLLDVAAGSADMVAAIARWATRAKVKAELLATDINPRIVAIAREEVAGLGTVRVERQDALALPYSPGAFDMALCTLALHHFDPPAATELLRAMAQVARHVLVFDVARSRLAFLGAVLLTRVGGMDAMTRHDAPASVRRAYSRAELAALAQAADLRAARVWAAFPFRLALVASGAASSE
jgi:2-polyprenyl-3-methyl-5-hydroxy-6-metoxy-1,4-benzoquinol methylase